MKKNKVNLNNATGRSKTLILAFLNSMKAHIDALLLLVFLIAVSYWGYIFYEEAYKAVVEEPEVFVTSLKIKESQLNYVIEDIRLRERGRILIGIGEEVKNPFKGVEEEVVDLSDAIEDLVQ